MEKWPGLICQKKHKNFENTLFWSISSLSNGGLSKKSFVAILIEVEQCQFWISYENGFAMASMPANNVDFVSFNEVKKASLDEKSNWLCLAHPFMIIENNKVNKKYFFIIRLIVAV